MLIEQPEKVATPELAVPGLVVHVNVPPPGLVPMASVTLALLDVTVLPPASCTVTAIDGLNATPAVMIEAGCVVKASWVAAPTATLSVFDVAVVMPVAVAVNV